MSYSETSILSSSSSNSIDDEFDTTEDDWDEEEAEESDKFNSCAYYTIIVLDFETGLHYNLDKVLVNHQQITFFLFVCLLSEAESTER